MRISRVMQTVLMVLLIPLLLMGCVSSEDMDDIKALTVQCVEDNEEELLELYQMYELNVVDGIGFVDIENIDGLVMEYDDREFVIILPEAISEKPEDSVLLRACQIIDDLIKQYDITDINYYDNLGMMEIWFPEDYYDCDFALIYYASDADVPEDIVDKEHSVPIKNGFYTYFWYPG